MRLFGKNYREEFEQLSQKYDELQSQNKQLNEAHQKLKIEHEKLTEESQLVLSMQQLKPIELSELIDTKENEVHRINGLINDQKAKLTQIQ